MKSLYSLLKGLDEWKIGGYWELAIKKEELKACTPLAPFILIFYWLEIYI